MFETRRVDVALARANGAVVALGICALINGVGILSDLAQVVLLGALEAGHEVSDTAIDLLDGAYTGTGIAWVAAFVVSGVFWLRWLHAAYGSLREVGSGFTERTPGWAVGYWFVPVLNLFRPYRIVSELWYRSEAANSLDAVPTSAPKLVDAWWALWILSTVADRLLTRWQSMADTLDKMRLVAIVTALVELATLVAAILAIRIVRSVSGFQRAWAGPAHLSGSGATGVGR